MIESTNPLFGRMVTAMVTPFDENLAVDFKAVDRLVDHLLQTGTTAIVINGTTGESPTLEDEERIALLTRVRERIGTKAKIIMGTGYNSTAKSIKSSQQAEKSGADGLLLVVPYYNKPSASGMSAHFAAVAESTSLPIMLYNIPGRTGVNLPVDITLELLERYPNIQYLKDSTGGTEQAAEIAFKARSDFRIYCGDDNLLLPFLSIGACGVVSVASHIVGNHIRESIECYFRGEINEARRIYSGNLALFKALFASPNPTCIKYALFKLGLCKPYLRLPLIELTAGQRASFDQIFANQLIDKVHADPVKPGRA